MEKDEKWKNAINGYGIGRRRRTKRDPNREKRVKINDEKREREKDETKKKFYVAREPVFWDCP